MTGDPIGSVDRSAFDASGVDLCCDKTPEGLDTIEVELRRVAARMAATASLSSTPPSSAQRQTALNFLRRSRARLSASYRAS
mmetsp:Transcript_6254/g.15974  ORF Transcript_6254/g.15974 Transcript_6254/m.15974 type:complete len:82 (-) Transcript_6254:80-325(-)